MNKYVLYMKSCYFFNFIFLFTENALGLNCFPIELILRIQKYVKSNMFFNNQLYINIYTAQFQMYNFIHVVFTLQKKFFIKINIFFFFFLKHKTLKFPQIRLKIHWWRNKSPIMNCEAAQILNYDLIRANYRIQTNWEIKIRSMH